jgi:hypothetical protein
VQAFFEDALLMVVTSQEAAYRVWTWRQIMSFWSGTVRRLSMPSAF